MRSVRLTSKKLGGRPLFVLVILRKQGLYYRKNNLKRFASKDLEDRLDNGDIVRTNEDRQDAPCRPGRWLRAYLG